MKRFLFFFAMLAATAVVAGAQDRVSTYVARLGMSDPRTGARIEVSNDAEVAAGLQVAPRSSQTVGYRICIFFDNTQNGRSLANGALGTFRSHFPGIPGEVIYDSPTFRTMVGYCADVNEASMLLGRVREYFSNAVMREENMSIAALKQSPVLSIPRMSSDSVDMKEE